MQEESSNGLFTTSIQITQVHPKECDLNDQVKKEKKSCHKKQTSTH